MIAAQENRIHVGIGTYIGGGVTVFPVWPETPEVRNFGWKPGALTVGEVEQGARVSELQVTNESDRPQVIIEGDIFEGGWQTRTAAETTVLMPGETREVPVLCVEQGRWGGERRHANSRTRRTPYGVRKRMYDSRAKRRGSAQGEVWDEIHKMQTTRGMANATGSLSMSLDSFKRDVENGLRFTSQREEFVTPRILAGQRGVMIGINGTITACEIFGSTTGLRERFEAMIDSARFEAGFALGKKTANYKARDFATAISTSVDLESFVPEPIDVATPVGPLAVTSFALGTALVYAAILNQQDMLV